MGRPSKYNAERHEAIVALIADGAFRTSAAKANRISHTTMCEWLSRGRAGEEPFATFLADVEAAESSQETGVVKGILDSGKVQEYERKCPSCHEPVTFRVRGDWKARAWFLDKRHRRLYGQQITNVNVETVRDRVMEAVHAVCSGRADGDEIFGAILDKLAGDGGQVADADPEDG